ncbi:MAG TPA: hypothetical protein VES66_11240 [Terriglobales bacterium]|nr:hypothetical protein [Terriglobales bacterium]
METINQMQADGVIGKYAIGEAVGATFYLEPAATLDVDIFVTLPTSPGSKLLSLAPIYDYLMVRSFKVEQEHVVIGDWPVQFLPPSNDLEREALTEAVETEVEGVKTWVMTAEHLVAIALNTARPKDHARILQFLEQNVVNADKLKLIFLRHGLLPKWKNFEGKYLDKDANGQKQQQ